MKKILIGLFVIVTMAARSQCSSATTLTPDGSWLGSTTFTGSEQWHDFRAALDNYKIKIYIQSYNSSKHSVTLYSGNCGSPTVVSTTTLTSSGDSLQLAVNSLTISSTYYIKLGNGNSPTGETYNISVLPVQTPSVTLTLATCTAGSCVYNVCGELVCNGGFECGVAGTTVTGTGQINDADNWTTANWGSPDYFSPSAVGCAASVTCNFMGQRTAYAGNRYAGLVVYTSPNSYNEYIQTRLTSPLQSGKSYLISFWVTRGERSAYQVNSLAVYTSSTQIYQGPPNEYTSLSIAPAASVTNVSLLNNFTTWQRVSFCYTPSNSNEQYLIIGSPVTNQAATSSTANPGCNCLVGFNYNESSYIYIDEVSVVPMNSMVNTASHTICPSYASTVSVDPGACAPSAYSYSIAWTPTTGLTSINGYTVTANISNTTTYGVAVTINTDDGATCASTTSVTINTFPAPGLTITPTTYSFCPYSTITLSATPGFTSYAWTPGSATNSSIVITPSDNVTYTVNGVNSNGCADVATVALTALVPNYSFAPTASPAVICTNLGQSSTTLTAISNNTATTYTWDPGAITGASTVVSPTVNTTYTLTASVGGCTMTQPIGVAISSACCSSTLIPNFNALVFPSQQSYNSSLIFNADVTVTQGNTVWLTDVEYLFAPGVKIIVKNGAQLNIEGVHFRACSTSMWKGVVVEDGGSVRSYSATALLHSLIEDAETAIDASGQYTSTLTLSGGAGIVDLKNTTFNKNYVSVKIGDYTQTNSTYPFQIRECVFTCRSLTYTPTSWPGTGTSDLRSAANPTTGLSSPYDLMGFSTATLLAPYSGSISNTALYVSNTGTTSGGTYYAVRIGSVSNTTDFNLFDSHVYGIKAINSNVESLNNVFQNGNTSNSYPAGVAISHSVGTSNNMILNLYSGSTDPSLGNRFWNWPTSVAVANIYSFNCQYATFRSTQNNTVTPSAYNPGNYAIFSLGNRFNYEISNNNFNNINTGYRMMLLPGVYATGGGTAYGVYANNISIQNNFFGAQLTSTTGVTSQYLNQAVMISSAINYTWNNVANTGLYINGNTIDKAYRGINVTGLRNYPGNIVNNTIKLADDNLYNASQKGIYIANNMLTLGVSTNTLQASGTTNTLVSLIYSGIGANHIVTCNDLRSANRGFEFIGSHPGGAQWKGNTMQPMPIGFALVTGGVIGTQGATTTPIDDQWSGTWTGYDQTYVDMTSDAQFSKIWVQSGAPYQPVNNNGPFPQYYGAPGNINTTTGSYSCGGGGVPPNLVVPNTSSLSNSMGYIANDALYRYLKINPDSIQGSVLTTFVNSFSLTSHDYFMQVEGALNSNAPSTATTLLASVSPTNTAETNMKTFYNLFVDYLNNSFDATDSTTLHDMIGDCPGIYGSWVYQARALYDQIYRLTSPPEMDCLDQPAAGRANPAANNNPGISTVTHDVTLPLRYNPQNVTVADKWKAGIYPNPAKNDLYIGSSSNNEELNVKIEDVQGRLLIDKTVKIENHSVYLQLDLQSGIYFVTLTNSRNESVTQKLLLSK
jgi:hypothetical protein